MELKISVATVDIRTRIPQDVIEQLASQIAGRFHPQKIILFGSYAYGNPGPLSDVDLLIIMDTSLREVRQALEIRQFLNPLFGVDILVYTPEKLKQRLDFGDAFLKEIIAQGKILYESGNTWVGRKSLMFWMVTLSNSVTQANLLPGLMPGKHLQP